MIHKRAYSFSKLKNFSMGLLIGSNDRILTWFNSTPALGARHVMHSIVKKLVTHTGEKVSRKVSKLLAESPESGMFFNASLNVSVWYIT